MLIPAGETREVLSSLYPFRLRYISRGDSLRASRKVLENGGGQFVLIECIEDWWKACSKWGFKGNLDRNAEGEISVSHQYFLTHIEKV